MKKISSRAFTLIELLLVISIIALISSIVLSSVQEARNRSIDTAFRQEMNQFIVALELYKQDYGEYPGIGFECDGGQLISFDSQNSLEITNPICTQGDANILGTFMDNNYMSKLPQPSSLKGNVLFQYYYIVDNHCSNDPLKFAGSYSIYFPNSGVFDSFSDWTNGNCYSPN